MLQLIVPALVNGAVRLTELDPIRLRIALVAMVRELPLMVPPDQLNWPLKLTGAERLIVPPEKLTVSPAVGTPVGVQLLGLYQSLLAAPVQFRVV